VKVWIRKLFGERLRERGRSPSFYRALGVELLAVKHPVLLFLVPELQRRRVSNRLIRQMIFEGWGENISEAALSNFYRLRIFPVERQEAQK